jgi:hypothetical protein
MLVQMHKLLLHSLMNLLSKWIENKMKLNRVVALPSFLHTFLEQTGAKDQIDDDETTVMMHWSTVGLLHVHVQDKLCPKSDVSPPAFWKVGR